MSEPLAREELLLMARVGHGFLRGPFEPDLVAGPIRALRRKGMVMFSQWAYEGRIWEDDRTTESRRPDQVLALTDLGKSRLPRWGAEREEVMGARFVTAEVPTSLTPDNRDFIADSDAAQPWVLEFIQRFPDYWTHDVQLQGWVGPLPDPPEAVGDRGEA